MTTCEMRIAYSLSSELWLLWLYHLAPLCHECAIYLDCEEECCEEYHDPPAVWYLMLAYSWLEKYKEEN